MLGGSKTELIRASGMGQKLLQVTFDIVKIHFLFTGCQPVAEQDPQISPAKDIFWERPETVLSPLGTKHCPASDSNPTLLAIEVINSR